MTLASRGRDLGLAILVAERHAKQRQRRHQRIHRIVGEGRAQLERLDLGTERSGDQRRLGRVGAFDQDVEMAQPVENAARGERQPPHFAIEAPVAIDPVERQAAGEGALLVGARVAEMAEPGEGLQIVEPVVMHHLDGEGRHAIGVDELAREQIPALHHFEQGFPVGRAEFAQRAAIVFVARTGPNPTDQRIADGKVGNPLRGAARKERYRVSQPALSHTRSSRPHPV